MSPRIDLIGQRFGLYLVIGPRETRPDGNVYYTCRCDCGTVKSVSHGSLRSGRSASCGCARNKATAERSYRHGSAVRTQVTEEYKRWLSMRQRCENPANPAYARYGGRGITVCERWDDFAAFLADMGPRPSPQHSIERTNNDLGYEPSNCKWATKLEQANNKSNSHHLTHRGETHTIAEWARLTGIDHEVIRQRLGKLGWSVERALTQPPAVTRPRRKPKV
jgi:hypothetical protein